MQNPTFRLTKKVVVLMALIIAVFYLPQPQEAGALTPCQQTCYNDLLNCENRCEATGGAGLRFCLESCTVEYSACLTSCK